MEPKIKISLNKKTEPISGDIQNRLPHDIFSVEVIYTYYSLEDRVMLYGLLGAKYDQKKT